MFSSMTSRLRSASDGRPPAVVPGRPAHPLRAKGPWRPIVRPWRVTSIGVTDSRCEASLDLTSRIPTRAAIASTPQVCTYPRTDEVCSALASRTPDRQFACQAQPQAAYVAELELVYGCYRAHLQATYSGPQRFASNSFWARRLAAPVLMPASAALVGR